MAAEISLAQLTGRNPAFVKKGMEFLARGSALPRQITELAGAVATFFLNGDHLRRSKKLFLHSLADPTANSLAQAEWASPHFQGSLIDERRWHHASFANEALAQHAFREGDFETALLRCIDWISEEPFSARAFIAASLVASTLDDYNQAADFAKQGLRHNRKSAPLNNTLAFSLASKGELDAAEAVLRKFAPANDDHMSRLISEANHGLIAMRRGDLATGESIYRRVIFRFRQENKVERVATAYAYFAREAANAKHPQAVEILAEAKSWLAAHNYPLARRVIASTEKILTPDVMSSNRGIRRS
jgi:Tfp pilus assembly protein PilF